MEYNPKRIFYLERYYLDLVQHQGANETYKREKFLYSSPNFSLRRKTK